VDAAGGWEGSVTSGGARRGRRDNGLVAAAYAAAGDVDPRVGEHLLDVLGLRGIAAYLQPAADLHPVTRTTTLPSRPTDRLYVDREHLQTAQGFLAQLGPDTPPEATTDDIDEVFAGIVAGFNAEVETATWPAAEDMPGADDTSTEPADPTESTPTPRTELTRWARSTVTPAPAEPSLLDGLDTFGAGLDGDPSDDEGYRPPPPPPLPRPRAATVLAVVAILAGAVLLFNPDLLPLGESVSMVLGFAGIAAGFVMLVLRLRSGDDDDDDWDPDNGAVV
jgi:hypothetical protein